MTESATNERHAAPAAEPRPEEAAGRLRSVCVERSADAMAISERPAGWQLPSRVGNRVPKISPKLIKICLQIKLSELVLRIEGQIDQVKAIHCHCPKVPRAFHSSRRNNTIARAAPQQRAQRLDKHDEALCGILPRLELVGFYGISLIVVVPAELRKCDITEA